MATIMFVSGFERGVPDGTFKITDRGVQWIDENSSEPEAHLVPWTSVMELRWPHSEPEMWISGE